MNKKLTMLQTMRWFGPNDTCSLNDLRQAGIEGIVTALHHIAVGEVWTVEEIEKRKQEIENEGMTWTVIESLPVHEDIKAGFGDFQKYIENYKISIENVAKCGLEVITYNFMPLFDWLRTHHNFENADGTFTLRFDYSAYVFFDVYLLKRENASHEYSAEALEKAEIYGKTLSEEDKTTLFNNIMLGLPGSKDNFTVDRVLDLMNRYKTINNEQLLKNLLYFLSEISPTCIKNNVKMAIHPDDPPFSVIGLPRIVGTEADLEKIFYGLDNEVNGLCFCTGSLGANFANDTVNILNKFEDKVHFLHLRNVSKDADTSFMESQHLNGDVPMAQIVLKISDIMQKRGKRIPMRPDHGFLMNIEKNQVHYPGYSLIGRLKGLAEIRGLEMGLNYRS